MSAERKAARQTLLQGFGAAQGQLNKGENLNGLRETVNFAHGGAIRHRQLVDLRGAKSLLCL